MFVQGNCLLRGVRTYINKRISHTLNRESILTVFLCLLVFDVSIFATEFKLLGDESDGSMSPPPHLIPLYAENEAGEKGEQITPDMDFPLPFSMRPGRPGEPWVYYDPKLCLQIPLSYRRWAGTYRPEQFGLTEFRFTKIFGRHFPGGGPGETDATDVEEIGRQLLSGKLEINCLACHNAHYGQDMGGLGGYAVQVSRENFRWAATASSEFASVTGAAAKMLMTYDPFMPDPDQEEAPTVIYHKEAFNENNEVLFHIVRQAPNERCYYCHSDLYQSTEETEKWTQDEDIHLTAGLKCVDCHRNGVDHNIIRGYTEEGIVSDNPLVATSSCESCHLPEGDSEPVAGRLGAPVPTHPGIPTVHFDKLTCTACHSGPWPAEQTILTKTSRAHRLGTPNVNKAREGLPHIFSPVFAKQQGVVAGYISGAAFTLRGDKLAPHKALWPTFWGVLEEDRVKPIELSIIEKVVGNVFADIELASNGDWPVINKEMIAKAIKALSEAVTDKAVYIAGGKLYSIDDSGNLIEQENHPAAEPYLWPIGHNVRPAAQALGVRYCTDCHATNAPFFFGNIRIDTPIDAEQDSFKRMIEFQDISPTYAWAFAASFVFRPWLKIIAGGSFAVIASVLLLYALRALACVIKALAVEDK
jgi:hypothetical protein